jgi:hypothetical protein
LNGITQQQFECALGHHLRVKGSHFLIEESSITGPLLEKKCYMVRKCIFCGKEEKIVDEEIMRVARIFPRVPIKEIVENVRCYENHPIRTTTI